MPNGNEIELVLDRIYPKLTHTIGNLIVEHRIFCNTLEDRVRDINMDGDLEDYGEIKIPGETAIPYGRYPVIITYSYKFRRHLPLIIDVKQFTGIRIHRGRTVKNTRGCVLVGDNTSVGQLTNGAYYEKKLTSMINNYISSGFKVFINII